MKRRIRLCRDRFRMHHSIIGLPNQVLWGHRLTEKICKQPTRTNFDNHHRGTFLFNEIPPNMCEYVTRTRVDPYNSPMDKFEVRQWLWDHVVFGPKGQIVAIHDCGQMLVVEDGWQPHLNWFGRVKMADARKEAYSNG